MPMMLRKEPVSSGMFRCSGTGYKGILEEETHNKDSAEQGCSVCLRQSQDCKVMEHVISAGNEGLVLDRDLYQRGFLQDLGYNTTHSGTTKGSLHLPTQ